MRLIPFKGPKKNIRKTTKFIADWRELQAYCKDKDTWHLALLEADKLLDRALKKRRFKGKSMGERMVSAQNFLTENDSVWYSHNLVKKLKNNPEFKLRERDVKRGLVGFRQALRDIGALPNGDQRET